ncbi:hypothetical protein QYF36_010311 [Acer negundo]|nr:hypothetical protein QYF36_010311 [Acer negundo]
MKCLRCEKAEESMEHALLWCHKAKEVWSKSASWCLISDLKGLNSQDVLRFVYSKTLRNDLAFFLCVCSLMELMVGSIITFVHKALKPMTASALSVSQICWLPAPYGYLELNFDAL